ncbi:hypothetical protein C8N32_104146 [Rhodovulum imhoffii]|uniref:Uncharacterized protein n=1 Tax=Rhodovulum imhoffii TaxID=365340 RepID=A0A2T5BU89_9RHOB|nr:hypothetical protein [Rhodovulum imhoffii]MBK5934548.1 hypothetical protein [Rhodovulum imhoffii]PTN03035.1 hypothetical protein C8N32_104146 [Rhodovulum imhoffii]
MTNPVRFLALAAVAALAGCDSPGPFFAPAPATRVTVDGSEFSVRRRNEKAQAIRLNRERRDGVMRRAHEAIEIATGCIVVPGTLRGDPALVRATVYCAP